MDAASNPMQALEKAGVSREFISDLAGQVNTPMGNKILSFAGINPQQAEKVLTSLSQGGTPDSAVGDLEKYRRGLERL